MLHPDELMKDGEGCLKTAVRKVEFSLDGDTLYVVTKKHETLTTLMAWDISREKYKARQSVDFEYYFFGFSYLVAVRTGVLFNTGNGILQLWNSALSKCILSWTDIGYIGRAFPISEERVACKVRDSNEVIILDATSGDIVSTITIHGELVACNSKCQVITTGINKKELQMQCGDVLSWKISQPFDVIPILQCNTFSPTEQYCVVGGQPESGIQGNVAFYVLDVASGKTLHMLCTSVSWFLFNPDCKFVSDEDCVISNDDVSRGCSIQLFNVKSGDLLSEIAMESKMCSLAACPHKRLVAIGLEDSKHSFKVLKVKLPRDRDSRKN